MGPTKEKKDEQQPRLLLRYCQRLTLLFYLDFLPEVDGSSLSPLQSARRRINHLCHMRQMPPKRDQATRGHDDLLQQQQQQDDDVLQQQHQHDDVLQQEMLQSGLAAAPQGGARN